MELANGDRCCGAAGLYNVLEPEMSGELMRQKAEAVRDAGVRVVASANPGCTMQIAAGLRDWAWTSRSCIPWSSWTARIGRLPDGTAACWYRRAMTYVGVGRRFVAIFVDSIVLLILSGPFAEIRHGDGYLQFDWTGRRMFWPSLIVIVYFVLLEGIAGATIGKFLTGIRVVNQDGTKLTWSGSIVRNIARLVDAFPYVHPVPRRGDIGVGLAHPATTRRSMGEHGRRHEGVVARRGGRTGYHRGRRMAACPDAATRRALPPARLRFPRRRRCPRRQADGTYHWVSVAPSATFTRARSVGHEVHVSSPATCFR